MKKVICVLFLFIFLLSGCSRDRYLTDIPIEERQQYDAECMELVRKAAGEAGLEVLRVEDSEEYRSMLSIRFSRGIYDYVIPMENGGFITIDLCYDDMFEPDMKGNTVGVCYMQLNETKPAEKYEKMDLAFYADIVKIFTGLEFTKEDYLMITELQNHNVEGGKKYYEYCYDFDINPRQMGLPLFFRLGSVGYRMNLDYNVELFTYADKEFRTDKITKEFRR